ANSAADVVQIFAAVAAYEANRASILGGYNRRQDDWDLQARLADKELASIKTQITAAEIRRDIAKEDLKNHKLQIENAKKTDEFMRDKFTNDELYQWMIGQISSVYYSAYKLAYSYAKKAERAYQFELGHSDSFISFGYWDSRKKGLQSADNLIHDIKRMETAYLDNHKREYEVTKHISLASLDPLALAKLRATGSCDFTVPEALFDLDHAGHYFRRTKTVGMSLPCIAGPHTSVSAKLSLVSNKYRKNVNPDNLNGTGYAEDPGNDERFFYNVGAIQSIVTSNAQQDSGLFELNFRDDRYLPFEGTGAISTWRIELPNKDMAQFNYDTIADVVLHLSYTAREGGSSLRTLAETDLTDRLNAIQQELSQTGLHTTINFKHEMPNEWHLLKTNGTAEVILDNSRLPYLAQAMAATIEKVILLAKADGNPANLPIDIDTVQVNLARIDAWKTCKGETTAISLDTAFTIALTPANLGKLQDLTLVIKYGF
ncbi:MAG: toxin, partial [Candidatus Thorarchaeota archaeon]